MGTHLFLEPAGLWYSIQLWSCIMEMDKLKYFSLMALGRHPFDTQKLSNDSCMTPGWPPNISQMSPGLFSDDSQTRIFWFFFSQAHVLWLSSCHKKSSIHNFFGKYDKVFTKKASFKFSFWLILNEKKSFDNFLMKTCKQRNESQRKKNRKSGPPIR